MKIIIEFCSFCSSPLWFFSRGQGRLVQSSVAPTQFSIMVSFLGYRGGWSTVLQSLHSFQLWLPFQGTGEVCLEFCSLYTVLYYGFLSRGQGRLVQSSVVSTQFSIMVSWPSCQHPFLYQVCIYRLVSVHCVLYQFYIYYQGPRIPCSLFGHAR